MALLPDVSVIIVSWNCKKHLLKCLESIRRHTKSVHVEVIVVDNASSDGTAEALKAEWPNVKLVETGENYGFARGNNIGIAQSSGRYICLVNPDVEFLNDCLGNLCRYMDEEQGVGICGPKILNPDGSVQYSCREFPTLWKKLCFALGLHRLFPGRKLFSNELMSYFSHDEKCRVEALSGCFMVARRQAVESVGPLDERFFMYSEDVDWCRRFRDRGWDIVFNPVTSAIHYGGGSSATVSVRAAAEQQKAILQYWAKHHTKIETAMLRSILFLHHALRAVGSFIGYVACPPGRAHAAVSMQRAFACIRCALGTVRPERLNRKD